MADFAVAIAVSLMFPPPILAVFSAWLVSKKTDENGIIRRKSFGIGALVSTSFATAYYGFLSLLAGINATSVSGGLGALSAILILSVITLVLALICFGIYTGAARAFRRAYTQ